MTYKKNYIQKINFYPYYDTENGETRYRCGGALINQRYVITAGHCVEEKNPVVTSVRLGEWNIEQDIDCLEPGNCADEPKDIPVEEIIKHKFYIKGNPNFYHDIALLRLTEPVEFSYFIKPICLPSISDLKDKTNYTGTIFTTAGWGQTEEGRGSNILNKLLIKGVRRGKCNRAYRTDNLNITERQICAGTEEGKDTCQGDSGGPLMAIYRIGKKVPFYYLAGVISFGKGCGVKGYPGIYTSVGSYMPWIKSKLKP